jgi:hypothetical protein
MSATVLAVSIEGVPVKVRVLTGPVYGLFWGDEASPTRYVETYPTLSAALARMAVLAACLEADPVAAFVDTQEDFARLARQFTDACIT